jgi:hypothetical protein
MDEHYMETAVPVLAASALIWSLKEYSAVKNIKNTRKT